MNNHLMLTCALAAALLLAGCPQQPGNGGADKPAGGGAAAAGRGDGKPLTVVCTTGMLADAARAIGGAHVEVHGLMGPGVDPHLYKARPSDMELLSQADLVIYHGLHLEAKLADVLEQLGRTRPVLAAAQDLPPAELITPEGGGGAHDPHVWFDVELWQAVCANIAAELRRQDPAHDADYQQAQAAYHDELAALHKYIEEQAARVPEQQRVIVTAHDAFNYFGRRYGFEVVGLQGISTEAEAGTGDVQELAAFIAERKLPAIFVESSVPVRNIEALIAAAQAKGHSVRIGGELFSDALGNDGTPEGTYTGMVRHNVDTIVAALGGTGE